MSRQASTTKCQQYYIDNILLVEAYKVKSNQTIKIRLWFQSILKTLVIMLVTNLFSLNLIAKSTYSTLTIPPEFNLIAINGKANKPSHLRRNRDIHLRQGENRLAFEYSVNWEKTKNIYTRVLSKAFIVSINLINNQSVRLTYLKPANLIASRQYALAPNIKLVTKNNQSLPIHVVKPFLSQSLSIIQQTKINQSFKKMSKPINIVNKKSIQNKSKNQQ